MTGYVPLPAYRTPDPIDFTPINNAFAQVGQTNYRNALLDNDQQRFGAEQQQRQLENTRADKRLTMDTETHKAALEDADLTHKVNLSKAYGGWVQTILANPDPVSRAQQGKALISSNSAFSTSFPKYGIDPNDTDAALKFILAQAKGYQDPRDSQLKDIQVEAGRVGIRKDLADIQGAEAKNKLNDSIAGMFSDGNGADTSAYKATGPDARGAAQPPPSVQPQSYYSTPVNPALQPAMYGGNPTAPGNALAMGPQSNIRPPFNALAAGPGGAQPMPGNALARDPSMQPGPTLARAGMAPRNALADGGMLNPALQLVSDDSAAQPPAPPSAAAPGANDMVDTPLGRMPRALAQRRAMGLALAGKGDAGKMLSDSVTTAGIGTTTRNQIEEKTMNSAMALGRLDDIDKGFDPKYLEIPNRMKMLGASWSAKFGGKLSPDVQNDLGKYAAFRARAVGNLSLNLKELSGAQVTPQEYERIQAAMPAAGTGVFDGDDPVSFKAKLDENRNLQRSAIARYNFMRSKGLNFDKDSIDKFLSLDDVPAAIDQRAAEIEDQIKQKNPKVDPMDLQTQTDRQIKQEFGI